MSKILTYSSIPKDGLVGYFPLNGNANDSVGTYTSTDTAPVYTIGRNGQARDYNGLGTNPITVVKTNATYSNFSISLWFNARNLGSYKGILGGSPFLVYLGGGTVQLLWSAGGFVTKFWSFTQTTNIWYHLIITFDGSLANDDRIKVYVDSVMLDDITFPTVPTTFDLGTTTIGADGFGYHYEGKIEEVIIFNKTLTQTEITILYNSSPKLLDYSNFPTNGLTSYWKLNGNSNDIAGTNNGIDTNITYINNYADFTTSTSKITITDLNITDTQTRTISITFKLDKLPAVLFTGAPAAGNGYLGAITATTNYFSDWVIGGIFNHNFSINTWYTLVHTFNNGVLRSYLNGIESTTGPRNMGVGGYINIVSFGGYDPSVYNLDGQIKEVGFWNRVLTQAEITTLYNNGAGRTLRT